MPTATILLLMLLLVELLLVKLLLVLVLSYACLKDLLGLLLGQHLLLLHEVHLLRQLSPERRSSLLVQHRLVSLIHRRRGRSRRTRGRVCLRVLLGLWRGTLSVARTRVREQRAQMVCPLLRGHHGPVLGRRSSGERECGGLDGGRREGRGERGRGSSSSSGSHLSDRFPAPAHPPWRRSV